MMMDGVFEPVKGGEFYRDVVQKAIRDVEIMSIADRSSGDAAPEDAPFDVHIRVAMCALANGIDTQNWQKVAEGFVMVQAAELRLRNECKR